MVQATSGNFAKELESEAAEIISITNGIQKVTQDMKQIKEGWMI